MTTNLSLIRIVLVEPTGPLNVGSIARVMKNMRLSQLVLVNPQCDPLSSEARQMAVHAADILERSHLVSTLPEALEGCRRAVATTGRDRTTLTVNLEHPRACLPWLLSDPPAPAALIFGREDRGLTTEELNFAQRFIRIPSSADYLSLNLAQAAAICCYELHEAAQGRETTGFSAPPVPLEPAPLEHLEGYYQQLEALLLKIGYLYPHTADSRMEKFRLLFNRAFPSEREVAMLRGILSQMEWALRSQASSDQSEP